GAARLRGAVAVRKGDYTNAIAPLERAIAAAPGEFEAHVWRAEAALRLGDYNAVHEHLHQSSMKASGFLFVSWVLRFLAVSEEDNYCEGHIPAFRLEEFIKPVSELCPGSESVLERRNERELVALLEQALARLGGNRTPMATSFDPKTGVVARLKAKSGARYSSRQALQLIRVMGPQQALAALDQVVADFPQSSLPVCHRGELELWMGNLEKARTDLERAIEILPQTRWAYIGLTGIDILEGNDEKALATSSWGVETMGSTEGPSVYIYRGDALRRVGRYDEALVDLTRSVRIHPSRVSAWFNLALLYAARGELELFERVYARLLIQAPGLLSDAAREVGEVLWGDPGFLPSVQARVGVIEHGLAMMRGNRSSTAMTYFTAGGNMRMVEHRDAATPVGHGPHSRDSAVLTRARNVVMSALGLNTKPEDEASAGGEEERRILAWLPEIAEPPTQAYELSPAQIPEFERRGFVTLKGCFSRELAKKWVDDACRRLAEEPENWVSPAKMREAGPNPPTFDPEDPETWAWGKLSLRGPRFDRELCPESLGRDL
ncbi:MAG: tetratricopeptide repeat protein, partial [Nannocystaceae bacterium]